MLASQPLVCLLKVQKCMKRMFKQLWSTILPISTKRTTISHLNSLNTKKKTTTYDIENPDPGLGQAQKSIYSGACLIGQTKGPVKRVGLYRMSEFSQKYFGTINVCRMLQDVRKPRCRIAQVPLYA